jgi:hypothetical protein
VAPDQTAPQPAVEAVAWRYNGPKGPVVDVWIASLALTAVERETLSPAREGQSYAEETQPEALGLIGLQLRFDDLGSDQGEMLAFCLPTDAGVKCSGGSGLGQLALRSISADRVTGAFYSRSDDGKTQFVARFDAALANESNVPLPRNAVWSDGDGAAAAAWLAKNAAMAAGDVATLNRHSLPDRQRDYDDSALRLLKSMALTRPRVLSAVPHADMARLWVHDEPSKSGFPASITTVELQRAEGEWRVTETRN